MNKLGKVSHPGWRTGKANQGGPKEVAQYFSGAERKELLTQNLIISENILQE